MANVWLGPEGSETVLPKVTFIGATPEWPVTTKKQIDKVRMVDGEFRRNYGKIKRSWVISFGYLSDAELTDLKNKNALKQILRFKNENEEDVWYEVDVISLEHNPERVDIRQLKRYKATMVLEEA